MNHPLGPDGREKRRYVRKPAQHGAQVRFAEGPALPGEIRDFCQAGLYVSLSGNHTPELVMPALVGAAVEVGFATGRGEPEFLLNGRVARIAPGGVGIFVPAMPEAALQALRAAGAQRAHPEGVAPGGQAGQTQALRHECTSVFRGFLDATMQAFFTQAMARLVQAGQDEPSFLERSRYEYGAQELMQARNRIEESFFNAIRERIQHVESDAGSALARCGAGDLSLVDEAEFEDWLNLSAVIKQIESAFLPQLAEFEQRYSRLVSRPVDRKSNPFGPETIGRTFQGAIQGLDFTNPMRTVLYKALGDAVSSHAPALYRQLNQTLAALQPRAPAREAGPQPKSPAAAPAARDDASPRPDLADLAETLNRVYREGLASPSPTAESAEYSLDRILASLAPARSQGAGVSKDAAHVAGTTAGDAGPGALLRMIDRMQHARQQLAGRTPAVLPPSLPAASLQEVLRALDSLPLVPAQAGTAAPTLAEQIDGRIESADGAVRALAIEHRQILDAASQLFHRARTDIVPSSEMESLIKRLERPLLKLALRDTRFPATPDHPARQVLNLVEQFAVAADDTGAFFDPKLQRFLFLLVDRVCSRADAEPGVYDMVRDSLAKVLLPILQTRRTRVARMQEASEGRERIRTARARVNAALETRLAGREVPGMLLRLLDAGWRQHLVLLEMREGMHSPAWAAGLDVLDRVLASLAPAHDGARGEPVAALLGEIERGLASVNVDTGLRAAFLDELGASFDGPSAPRVFVPPGRLAGRSTEGHAPPRLADRLRIGEWWVFSLEGRAVPMQLIWVSQPPYSCTFANRSATRKLDYTLDDLERQIREQAVKPGRDLDLPLLDRSEHALFDDSYRELVQQAIHDPLMDLPNRKGFMQRLLRQPEPADAGRAHVVGIIEFDQFRLIRNACGEAAVETLSRSLADRVRALIGPASVLAAFGEDTLALLLPDCSRSDGCPAVKALLGEMRDFPYTHGEHRYRIGFNIGLSEYAPTRFDAEEALRRADSACLTAKSLGRNQIQVYEQDTPQLQSLESLMNWAGRLDAFLEGNGLFLRCQRIMPLGDDGLLPYYEILLGVDDADGDAIDPKQFVPVVERLQRSHELDIWVIRKAFEWVRANPAAFASVGGFAINLSAGSLSHPEVIAQLRHLLADPQVPAGKIMFEITESVAIDSYGAAQEFIREIRRYGCRFSLDDFGSGFTSYAYLKNLQADTLKIDGSFVMDMLDNPADRAMVKSMNDIGHSLGLRTVAEYAESEAILAALKSIGVDYAQGYAIHKPCRIDELALSAVQ